MELYIAIPLFIVALIFVIKGGDIFVDASIKIANKCKIPAIIVGATIVSVATTLPELIVSITASAQGSFDLAIGNAIGSVICNTSLVCGISLAFAPIFIKNKTSPLKSYLLLFTILLMGIMSIGIESGQASGFINIFEGALLLILFIVYMFTNIMDAKKEIKDRLEYEKLYNKEHETNHQAIPTNTRESLTKLIILFLLGATMVALGAIGLVESAKAIAYALNISEAVVGFTIVAIGTSLPELVTTITSLRKKNNTLGYGNIIGANILNMTLICGTSACISGSAGLPINFWTLVVSIPVALVACSLFVLPMTIKQRTYRWQGISLIALYIAYLAFIAIMTFNGVSI